MKARILSLISLFALLLVSTAALSDGRPTGLRIGRLVSGGGANVQLDITITGTNSYYGSYSTAWLGADLQVGPYGTFAARRYASYARNVWVPYAIDWGDGSSIREVPLFSFGGSPFRGTFEHTYSVPGAYLVTAADGVCCSDAATATINTGTPITQTGLQYAWDSSLNTVTFSTGGIYPFADYGDLIGIAATATVHTGTGIPTTNTYGLIALALLLVGSGLLVYRRPQRFVT